MHTIGNDGMNNPLISIVIANYNYGRFLEEAIQSVLSQGMGNKVELIICDAASTDNSVEIIKKYADSIAWWCSEPDGGQSAAFNKGFAHARGKFLTWLNADDVILPGGLNAIIDLIERNPTYEWFVGSTCWVDKELRFQRCFCAHAFSALRAKVGEVSACGPSSFFTKRIFNAAGGIDETLHYCMDTDLWMKFVYCLGVRYKRTRKDVWAYRIHEDSKMSGADVSKQQKAIENRRKSQCEGLLIRERYKKGIYKPLKLLVRIISVSIVDNIIAYARTRKRVGKFVCSV